MRDFFEDFSEVFRMIFVGIILVILVASPIILLARYSSCRQANFYNEKNNTNYTCGDFFWAGDQINQQTQTIKLEK